MNKIIKLAAVIFILFSLSCTKDSDIALPEYKPTLVIHSYISPQDSGVIVYVNLSKSAYNNKFNDLSNIANATVKISDGVNTKTLVFSPATNPMEFSYYYIDSNSFKITVGKTYTLTVTTPEGMLATASTQVPSVVPINTLSYIREKTQFGDSIYRMSITFNDPSGQEDYYKYGTYLLTVDTVFGDIIESSSNEDYGTYFASDGNLISATQDAWPSFNPLAPEEIRVIDFRLMHVTREYYLYHLSIQNYGGGPFTEPSVAFTNITGGVGVFAGYNYDQRTIR